ncbi:hypothetical protein N7467_002748 [Penicillium canescens]|nr:hypothetical protein N7467_002748 [Penicillium canescens]
MARQILAGHPHWHIASVCDTFLVPMNYVLRKWDAHPLFTAWPLKPRIITGASGGGCHFIPLVAVLHHLQDRVKAVPQ